MLNMEQLLIKAAQYFDMNLKDLGIKQTIQKERLYKNKISSKKYTEIIHKILDNFNFPSKDSNIQKILADFECNYSYLSREIYSNFDEKRERELDWLLLKYFVIPYFAVNISKKFAQYNERIDVGLPGGLFWYLPFINKNKMKFPLNIVMDWWIDLFGNSKDKFYHANISTISPSTLKKWNNEFVLPDITSVQTLLKHDYAYDGCFECKDDCTAEDNFKLAVKFIKDKSITLEKLKDEIPNTYNFLDRLYNNELSEKEQGKFTSYIAKRWAKPSSEQIRELLIVSRVSQSIYKDLCQYYHVDINELQIEKNSIFQLIALYQYIYNTTTSLLGSIPYEISPLFEEYVHPIIKLQSNQKEALDNIMSIISNKLASGIIEPEIDEVILLLSRDDYLIKKAKNNINEEDVRISIQDSLEKNVLKVIYDIEKINSVQELRDYIKDISDSKLLFNIGQYLRGHNFLTNEKVHANREFALEIYLHYHKVATEIIHLKNAIPGILDLLTFPLFPRVNNKELSKKFIDELENIIDINSIREKNSLLQYKAYDAINNKNNQKALFLIKEFERDTQNLKLNEYIPELLFISENLKFLKKDRLFYKKLCKINRKHPQYANYMFKIYYY